MSPPDLWFWVAGGASAAAAGLIAIVWGDAKARLNKHETRIVDLYQKLEEHARRDESHFSELKDMMHENHVELLREVGKKVDR